MILDSLARGPLYNGLHPLFAEAFAFLERHGSALDPGRHAVRGEDLYASVSDYRTKPHGNLKFEVHERYIDIQLLARGRETILWAPAEGLAVAEPYREEKDVAFLAAPPSPRPCRLEPGLFAVFLPADAHAPGGAWESEEDVRKIVVKVRVAAKP